MTDASLDIQIAKDDHLKDELGALKNPYNLIYKLQESVDLLLHFDSRRVVTRVKLPHSSPSCGAGSLSCATTGSSPSPPLPYPSTSLGGLWGTP